MAENNTEEKKQEELEKIRAVSRDTIESELVQKLIGGANVKSNPYLYGQLGLQGGNQTYADAKSSEDFGKRRGEMYKQAVENKDPRNPEEPFVSDSEVVQSYLNQVDQGTQVLTLGELESTVKGLIKKTGSSLDYELPEELKGKSYNDLVEKAIDKETGKIDTDKLEEEDKYTLTAHKHLVDAYQRACGLNAASANYFADINSVFEQISKDYHKDSEKESSE